MKCAKLNKKNHLFKFMTHYCHHCKCELDSTYKLFARYCKDCESECLIQKSLEDYKIIKYQVYKITYYADTQIGWKYIEASNEDEAKFLFYEFFKDCATDWRFRIKSVEIEPQRSFRTVLNIDTQLIPMGNKGEYVKRML